ncbi:MAG: tRNA 2-selenouridine(34) synthase MnmH [Bacteroidales bacterium]|jgi:tRNA 2-selenouridine synthase|nr:tRNA 2-selenouridine(34) synthase MnmH [Bacteroidales bacterium]
MAFILRKLPADAFLGQRKTTPVADVRSPGEYAEGHIPGAVNIPLFDDEQRAEVGTVYKKEGNINAVLRGIDLAAPGMSDKLRKALDLASGGKLLVHCWRGGMRSEAMAWLFSQGGIDSSLLEGGYKAYRNHILSDLDRERKFIILGGLTGSGKTGILRHMKSAGVQVTDLEGLASHRGSAFGALGQAPQPTSEHFANLLFDDLASMRDDEPVWLEDESRNIGTVFMPDCFSLRMQTAPVIALMMSIETRLPRLLEEYTTFPAEEIMASVMKISKRLGGDRTREAADALRKGDYPTAIRITLEYYDKAYHYGLSKRPEGQVTYINTETDDVGVNAALVMEAARNLG